MQISQANRPHLIKCYEHHSDVSKGSCNLLGRGKPLVFKISNIYFWTYYFYSCFSFSEISLLLSFVFFFPWNKLPELTDLRNTYNVAVGMLITHALKETEFLLHIHLCYVPEPQEVSLLYCFFGPLPHKLHDNRDNHLCEVLLFFIKAPWERSQSKRKDKEIYMKFKLFALPRKS